MLMLPLFLTFLIELLLFISVHGKLAFETEEVGKNDEKWRHQINLFMEPVTTIAFVQIVFSETDVSEKSPLIDRYCEGINENYTFLSFRVVTSKINCNTIMKYDASASVGLLLHLPGIESLRVVFESKCMIRKEFGAVLFVFDRDIEEFSFNDIEKLVRDFWYSCHRKIIRMGLLFKLETWVFNPFLLKGTILTDTDSFGGLIRIDDPKEFFGTLFQNLNGYPVKIERFPSVFAVSVSGNENAEVNSTKDFSYVGVDPEIEKAVQKASNYTGKFDKPLVSNLSTSFNGFNSIQVKEK